MNINEETTTTQHCTPHETIDWLNEKNLLVPWSRLKNQNSDGWYRNLPIAKYHQYDVEMVDTLWSLWGSLHPEAPVFQEKQRGKQYLACNVVACCAASVYPLTEWNMQVLDTIVISGDKYHEESLKMITQPDCEIALHDLNAYCTLANMKFMVCTEHVAFGKLYGDSKPTTMTLAAALMYFFENWKFGVLQCNQCSLAIGYSTLGGQINGGYFMFDCQSRNYPLFPKNQGASYLLRSKTLNMLLYCIVLTLNVSCYNVEFSLFKIEPVQQPAKKLELNVSVEEDSDEDNEDYDEKSSM